jgi:hypothetical protein
MSTDLCRVFSLSENHVLIIVMIVVSYTIFSFYALDMGKIFGGIEKTPSRNMQAIFRRFCVRIYRCGFN